MRPYSLGVYLQARLRNSTDASGGVEAAPDALVGEWPKVQQLARVWARRLEVLDKLNRAIDKCVAEETQDQALEAMAAMTAGDTLHATRTTRAASTPTSKPSSVDSCGIL